MTPKVRNRPKFYLRSYLRQGTTVCLLLGGIMVLVGLDVLHPDHVLWCCLAVDTLGGYPLLLNATLHASI